MKQYKKLDTVITRGQITINLPVIVLIIGIPALFAVGAGVLLPEKYIKTGILVGILSGLLSGVVAAWAWWSFKIAKWRIWAFENTKKSDWPLLNRRAINGNLIWPAGSKFEKTEIRTSEDKVKIKNITEEIEALTKIEWEILASDSNFPNRLDYYFDQTELILSLIIPAAFIGVGVYLMTDGSFVGLLSIGVGLYYTNLDKIKNIGNRKAQFSIGNDGLDNKNAYPGFVRWDDTQEITVDAISRTIQFGFWQGDECSEITLQLNPYKIGDYDEFLRNINVYLIRNSPPTEQTMIALDEK